MLRPLAIAAAGAVIIGVAVPALAQRAGASSPPRREHRETRAPAPSAEMLLELDLLRDTDLARQRDLYTRLRLLQQMRVLEHLPVLESELLDPAAAPVETGKRR